MTTTSRLLAASVCVAGLAGCADDPEAGSSTTAIAPTTETAPTPTTATAAEQPATPTSASTTPPDLTVGAPGSCRPAEDALVVSNGEARISVRTVGTGAPVLMIPSLARGVSDFDQLAADLAARGRMAILPDPRGIDGSTGPAPGGLGDLADDAAAVITELCDGPVDVVGHAFGQRVTRMLAARHPDKVHQVVILAAGGRVAMPDDVRQDLITSLSEGTRPDDERLTALQHVFFAAGQDPSQWLTGWTPDAAAAQAAATQATDIDEWWGGGSAPILAVQATEDPIAPAANSADLAAEFGDRINVVHLPHASHAILPEQPASVTAVIDAYLSGEREHATLQAAVDDNIHIPTNS